jgi:hypothetical protein
VPHRHSGTRLRLKIDGEDASSPFASRAIAIIQEQEARSARMQKQTDDQRKQIEDLTVAAAHQSPQEPILLVGDDRGGTCSLKLSPNLRKLTEVASHYDEETKLLKPHPTELGASPPPPPGRPATALSHRTPWQPHSFHAILIRRGRPAAEVRTARRGDRQVEEGGAGRGDRQTAGDRELSHAVS